MTDDSEAPNDFWSIEGNWTYRRHVEPRVKLYVLGEESFPTPLRYIDVIRRTHTALDVLQESRIDDFRSIDDDRNLSEHGPVSRSAQQADENSSKQQGLITCGQKFGPECQKAAQRKAKQQWAIEKPKLENAQKSRRTYFIDPDDEEFIETMKNARKTLELPTEAAMPCKLKTYWYRETCGESNNQKSKHACTAGAHESTRKRLSHCWGRVQFVESLQSCAQVHASAPSNDKSRMLKPCGQRVEEARKFVSMADDQGMEQRGGRSSTKRAKIKSFCCADEHLSSQECGVRTEILEVQRLAPRWLCERRLWLLCNVHRARFVSITNDGRKSNECHCKASRVCRTSSRRSIS